jgi:hypothetical protein
MSTSKCNGAASSALIDRTPRRSVINRRHTAIQVKSRRKSKPASVGQLSVGGRGDEGQPGFSLVFAKAVLFHQWVQSEGWEWSQRRGCRFSHDNFDFGSILRTQDLRVISPALADSTSLGHRRYWLNPTLLSRGDRLIVDLNQDSGNRRR